MVFRSQPPPPPPAAPSPPAYPPPPIPPYPTQSSSLGVLVAHTETPRMVVLDRYACGFAFTDASGKMISEEGKPALLWDAPHAPTALADTYTNDAHFCCYGVLSNDGSCEAKIPRLTKSVLPALPEYGIIAQSTQVIGTAIALDYDLPGHVRWNETLWTEFERLMAMASVKFPVLGRPTLWYTTSGGCRLVWVFNRAIPVEGVGGLEDRLGGAVATAHLGGLPVDPACRDWTRLFRLPRVVRDDKPPAEKYTEAQEYFRMSWGRIDTKAKEIQPPSQILAHDPDSFRCLSSLTIQDFENDNGEIILKRWRHLIGRPPATSSDRLAMVHLGPMPSRTEEAELDKIRYKKLRHYIQARAVPRGDAKPWPSALKAYSILYEGESIYSDPERMEGLHTGIIALARAIAFTVTFKLGDGEDSVTPEMIFQQVYYAAARDNRKRGELARPDDELRTEVWRAVTHVYRLFRFSAIEFETAKDLEKIDQAMQQEAHNRISLLSAETIKSGLKAWGRNKPGMEQAWDSYVEGNWQSMLLWECDSFGRSVVKVSPNGSIGLTPLTKSESMFYIHLRSAGHAIVSYRHMTKEGEEKLVPIPRLMATHGACASAVRLTRESPTSRIEFSFDFEGSPIANLILPAAGMRHDIEAQYDPMVDEWLHRLGGDHVDKLLDWLAVYADLSRPSAGLYLQGAPSIGKGMLVLGLRNMTISGMHAPFHEALDQFQDSMLRTPLVWADEESASSSKSQKSVMNVYKKLVTGEFNSLNGKSKTPVHVDGYWRVLLTANTDKLLRWDEDVSEADLSALVQRTLHIKCDSESALRYLADIGGRAGTTGWPEHNIPRHIQWLRENRSVQSGSRLSVEGVKTEFHERLTINTGGTDVVVRVVGHVIREPDRFPNTVFFKDEDGSKHVYINSKNLHSAMLTLYGNDRSAKLPSIGKVGPSMRHLAVGGDSQVKWLKAPGERTQKAHRVYEIDLTVLLRHLDHLGEPVDLRPSLGEACWRKHMSPTSDFLAAIDNAPDSMSSPPPPPPPPKKTSTWASALPGPGSHLTPTGASR